MRLLLDRRVHEGGGEAAEDDDCPHPIVAAAGVVNKAAEPGAEEGAELMREEGKAVE